MGFEVECCASLPLPVDDHHVDHMLESRVAVPGSAPAYGRALALLQGLRRPATTSELAGDASAVERLATTIRSSKGLAHLN